MLLYSKMLEKQQENEDERRKFEEKEEASEFWRALCEGTGGGNSEMEWVEDVREGLREVVPEIPTTGFKLALDKVLQAIRKKKNWSAPGPDLLANSCKM